MLFSLVYAGDTINFSNIQINSAVDVGLDTTKGISLDFVEDGATHKVLEIDLGESYSLSSQELLFLISDIDFSGSQISNEHLYVLNQQSLTRDFVVPSCSYYEQIQENGSIQNIESCTYTITTENYVEDVWEEIPLDTSTTENDFFSENSKVTGKIFHYSFDTPINLRDDGTFGSTGKVYVSVNGETFVNLQHSSWWATGFQYRKAIQINNSASEVLRKWYTLEVSGFDTSTSSFNQSNKNNFAVVCDGSEVDKIIANSTGFSGYSSNGYGTTNTTFFFRLPTNISASTINNTLCYIYYGDLTYNSTKTNISEIALLFDDFNRPNSATVGNSWEDNSYFEIVNNQLEDVGSSNGATQKTLDVGICYDCEKYEILFGYTWGGVGGGGIYSTFSDTLESSLTSNGYVSGSKGIFWNFADESNPDAYHIGSSATTTAVKENSTSISSGQKYDVRILASDDLNRGDWISYKDNGYVIWSPINSTDTTISTGTKKATKFVANRAGNKYDYIMIRRWMQTHPTITLGSEESYSGPGNSNSYIETGIYNAIPLAQIYTNQQVYARYMNSSQMLGTFDKIAVYRNQRWAFNYIGNDESFTRMYSMQPVLFIWENQSISGGEISSQVEAYIEATLILSS